MAAYTKTFNGLDYYTYGETEVSLNEAKTRQSQAKSIGYKTRVVKTKNGFSNVTGYSLYVKSNKLNP
jgi:hypothetical protein